MCHQKRWGTRLIGTNVLSIGIRNGLDKALNVPHGIYVGETFARDAKSLAITGCSGFSGCATAEGAYLKCSQFGLEGL